MNFKVMLTGVAMAMSTIAIAQKAPENWFNLDAQQDKVPGLSTERTYRELLKDRASQKVIVAVIDSGVDPEHEDLKNVMWVNPKEIPNNNIDDDKNGYVDDIHGWNFIGGNNGVNVHHDSYEVTRVYARLKPKYDNVSDEKSLSKAARKEYAVYKEAKETVETKRAAAKAGVEEIEGQVAIIFQCLNAVDKKLGGKPLNEANLAALDVSDDQMASVGVEYLKEVSENGAEFDNIQDIIKEIKNAVKEQSADFALDLDYHYNPDFDPRKTITKDDYNNSNQRNYGNNDVKGPDAMHGTHVAGIIGASRGNKVGMEGVANNVQIMSVRAVPDGDERDKDVANAIIYAVDNGAKIINMSFGKGFGSDKAAVDRAVKYAEKHDVLLVHAAGNSAQNNDVTDNFPRAKFAKAGWFKPKKAKNWLEIGALNWRGGESLPAGFSNYGKKNVDLFSPGVELYSTLPDGEYGALSGTSMAAPAAAGVAAILRAHFPELTAVQIKEAMMQSVVKDDSMVKMPSPDRKGDKVPFSSLSVSGGEVNCYKAVQAAMKMKGKNKVVKTVVP